MKSLVLHTVKIQLALHIADGGTLQSFKQILIPILQAKGWWGKKDVVDDKTGLVNEVQLGSAYRLTTIFRTNLQSSYAAGHWESITEQAEESPYLMYDAVDDHRTRSSHAANDGKVFAVDNSFWNSHYPPNGFNCRCGVIQMDADDLKAYGLSISNTTTPKMRPWTNPSTGNVEMLPEGVDGGFNHNVGNSYNKKLLGLLNIKTNKNQIEN